MSRAGILLARVMEPRFITFEGLDGSGKSTHLRWVARYLDDRGIDHLVTHEPGGTALGESIREVFLDPRWGALDGTVEALLVFASRRQHLMEVVDPALAAGRHVLCDRFTDSTYAYQGGGREVPAQRIATLEQLVHGDLQPDLTIYYDRYSHLILFVMYHIIIIPIAAIDTIEIPVPTINPCSTGSI